MRLASLKPTGLALVRDDTLIPIGDALAAEGSLPANATMIDLITNFGSIAGSIQKAADGRGSKLDPRQLAAPVQNPSKIWAAAGNYRRGGTGLENTAGRGQASSVPPEELLEQAFLKPPTAICGPEDAIIFPPGVETIFPELELCAVIGRETRNIPVDHALDAVFGYTIMLDVTARNQRHFAQGLVATRNVRKGYTTFAPIGPWITTRDEIPDPQALKMQLWVNDKLQQSATTDGMINGVAELVSFLSRVGPLYPGDLITTGNPDAPDFQEKLAPGDTLRCEIERIGSMTLYVRASP